MPFKQNKLVWLKQRASLFAGIIVYLALVATNIYFAERLSAERKEHLLNTGNTAHTTAVVSRIEVRRSRNSTSYYAVFRYEVSGKITEHPWYEQNKSDFIVGDKYEIKYVTDYPQMMMILSKLTN